MLMFYKRSETRKIMSDVVFFTSDIIFSTWDIVFITSLMVFGIPVEEKRLYGFSANRTGARTHTHMGNECKKGGATFMMHAPPLL